MSGEIEECELASGTVITADAALSIESLTTSLGDLPNANGVSFNPDDNTLTVPWFTPAFNIDLTKLDGFRLNDDNPYYKLQDNTGSDLTECTAWPYKISVVEYSLDMSGDVVEAPFTLPSVKFEIDLEDDDGNTYH